MWFRRRPERRDNHESRTFDDWRAVMRCTTSVRSPGFLNPFLSGFTLIEKVMLIGSAQSACLQNDDDSRWLEAQFEQAGQSRLTQVVRYYAYRIRENRGEAKWSQSRIELETCLHWAAQREIYIQEEVSALRKSCELNTDNFMESGSWHTNGAIEKRVSLSGEPTPTGISVNGYAKSVQGKGGCCGRKCGCCESPRKTHRHMRLGHCMTGCGCCIRHHGLDLGPEFTEIMEFNLDIPAWVGAYSARVERAYIWGGVDTAL
ncbi:hypothetical protein MW887_008802 [Aspergillus wentii]|nr:hypothetical protein MW887_008802 [Aspergillus wentii]